MHVMRSMAPIFKFHITLMSQIYKFMVWERRNLSAWNLAWSRGARVPLEEQHARNHWIKGTEEGEQAEIQAAFCGDYVVPAKYDVFLKGSSGRNSAPSSRKSSATERLSHYAFNKSEVTNQVTSSLVMQRAHESCKWNCSESSCLLCYSFSSTDLWTCACLCVQLPQAFAKFKPTRPNTQPPEGEEEDEQESGDEEDCEDNGTHPSDEEEEASDGETEVEEYEDEEEEEEEDDDKARTPARGTGASRLQLRQSPRINAKVGRTN